MRLINNKEMLQFRLIMLILFCVIKRSSAAEVDIAIETLKNRVTSLENEVSILKTEKNELLTVKSDVSFLLEKNSEIMEMLTKMSLKDPSVQSNEIAVVKQNDNLSYLQTISGMYFYRSNRFLPRKMVLVKMIKDLAGSIDNLVQVVSLDGGNEVKNGNQNVSVSIDKIEQSVEHILDQN